MTILVQNDNSGCRWIFSYHDMFHQIPLSLIGLRILLAPVLLLMYGFNVESVWYGVVLGVGLLSDVFDGMLARKLGIATEKLRSLDSTADTIFYVGVFLVAALKHPQLLMPFWLPLACFFLLEIGRHIFDQVKFGRSAAYHMWSAKAWGIFLFVGFTEILVFDVAGIGFLGALTLGILTNLEGLWASIILREWHHDVPTIYHAFALNQQRQ